MRYSKVYTLELVLFALFTQIACNGGGSTGPISDPIQMELSRAWGLLNDGEFSKSQEIFEDILDQRDDNLEAELGLGWSEAFSGDLTHAAKHLLRASENKDFTEDAYAGLAAVYRDIPNRSSAIAYCKKVLDLNSTYSSVRLDGIDYLDIHLIKATCHFRSGKSSYQDALLETNFLLDELGLTLVPDYIDLNSPEFEEVLLAKLSLIAEYVS